MAINKRTDRQGRTRYTVQVSVPNPRGGRGSRHTIGTFHRRKDADTAERAAQTVIQRGEFDPNPTPEDEPRTVADQLTVWLAGKRRSISANSHRDYEIAARRHLAPAFGSLPLPDLTRDLVKRQYTAWLDGGMSPRLIHRVHLVLSQALAEAVEDGILAVNPTAGIRKPRVERTKPVVWNPDEVSAFLDVAQRDNLSPLWHLLALEGLRRGEALGLRWQDVNWERGAVHISQTVVPDKSNRGKAVILPRTKTAHSSRTVKLSRPTLALLTEHRDRQRFTRHTAGGAWHDHDLIVCTRIGTPVNPGNVIRAYDPLVLLAGVPRIRVHDLRHTAASLMLRAGVPLKVASERLGHAGISITADLYSHLAPDGQDIAAEAMSAIMERTATGTADR